VETSGNFVTHNPIGDAFGMWRSMGRCGGRSYCRDYWIQMGRVMLILGHNYVIIAIEGEDSDEISHAKLCRRVRWVL